MPPNTQWNSGPIGQFHYRHFGALADRVEDLFKAHNAAIQPSSELAELIAGARALCAIADVEGDVGVSPLHYYHAQSFARLTKSVIFLDYRPQFKPIFHALKSGTINFWNSNQSKAKDTEWELLLWSHLNRVFPGAARLAEPDIVLRLAHREIGIACKRVYNSKRVQDQIRAGARQLRDHNLSGIVALSFDPYEGRKDDYCLLKAPDMNNASQATFAFFGDIWKRIARKAIQKHLEPNRVIGLIISVQGFVQIGDSTTNVAELSAFRLQTHPGTSPENQEIMDTLHRAGIEDVKPFENEILARLKHLEGLATAIGRS